MNRLILGGLLILTACSTPVKNPQPITAADRALAIEHIKTTFFDPFSIRSAEIAPASHEVPDFYKDRAVCLRVNAKNRMGAYAGRQMSVFFVRAGRLYVPGIAAHPPDHCSGARWQPFPEAEAMK